MIAKHFYEGGPLFMTMIYALWILVLIMAIRWIYIYSKGSSTAAQLKRQNNSILFVGSFGFLLGIFGQSIGLYQAFQAIYAAGDISPALIAGGLRVSMLTTLYGMALLLVSWLIWLAFRHVNRA
jgi:biopolymer transport protein ExbB/TolQ